MAGLLSACDTLTQLTVDLGLSEPETAKPTIPTPWAAVQFQAEDEFSGDGVPPRFIVSHVQVLLQDLGYPIGAIDGVKGPRTMAAIRAFQKAQGLSADGRVSATLVAQLQVARRQLMVRETQARLARLGYTIGPIDGRIGPRTRAAISVFQESEGLPVTGKVTPELVERLYSILPPVQPKPVLQAGPMAPPSLRGAFSSRIESAEATLVAAQRMPVGEVQIGPATSGQMAEAASADQERIGPLPAPAEERGDEASDEAPLNLAARPVISLSRNSPHDVQDGRPLSSGDRVRLSIGVAGSNVIEREVDGDGRIELPGGVSVLAAGLTLDELKHAITIKLVESFLLDLNVDVTRPGLAGDEATGEDDETGTVGANPAAP